MAAKRGRLSNAETDYIRQNSAIMSPADIAAKINRTVPTVAEYILHQVAPKTSVDIADRITIRQELYQSEKWKRLQQELTPGEIRYFEEEYVKLMHQFKGDGVLASEETQVFDAIRFDLLKSRNLIERRRARDDISRLEEMQTEFLDRFGGDASGMKEGERSFALNLEAQLQAARAAEQSRTTEYVKLQEQHQALMKSLKAMRDQRVKAVEDRRTNFLGVIKMLQERDAQQQAGREMELMRLAGAKEYESLGRPMKFGNGEMDNPILSADTVDLGPEELATADENGIGEGEKAA